MWFNKKSTDLSTLWNTEMTQCPRGVTKEVDINLSVVSP